MCGGEICEYHMFSFDFANYGFLEYTGLVCSILWAIFGLCMIQFAFFAIVGLFGKAKKYPVTQNKLRYGIIISARNEEKVIGSLIDSIRKNNYPQDKLEIFVVAHNCSDRTTEIARAHGATVYIYDNPEECTAGYAYRYLVEQIRRDRGLHAFDGYFIFDADNILRPDFISRMNDAFVATGRKYCISSFRNSGNFGQNYMTCMYGMHFLAASRLEARGRTVCNCSTRVTGTGFVFPADYIEEGYPYVTLTEDWEFTADHLCNGKKILYCDDAEFFDEQPSGIRIMLRQRLRWARGHLIVFFTRFPKLIKSIFTSKKKGGKDNKFSQWDIATSIMPIGAIGAALWLIRLITVAVSPLLGYDPAAVWAEYAISLGISAAVSYAAMFLSGVALLIAERKRIHNVKLSTKAAGALLYPLFLLVKLVLDVVCLFTPDLKWKTIPHEGKRTAGKHTAQRRKTQSI